MHSPGQSCNSSLLFFGSRTASCWEQFHFPINSTYSGLLPPIFNHFYLRLHRELRPGGQVLRSWTTLWSYILVSGFLNRPRMVSNLSIATGETRGKYGMDLLPYDPKVPAPRIGGSNNFPDKGYFPSGGVLRKYPPTSKVNSLTFLPTQFTFLANWFTSEANSMAFLPNSLTI